MDETVQLKYVGGTEIRFFAIDSSFAGILKPGDIFNISKAIYDSEMSQDKRYELITSKIKSKKYEGEGN
jgi:hypothetical protein